MLAQVTLSIKQIHKLLLNVATVRPVFIWGPPGVGKSSLVEQFAASLGLECVALLGSQLAPEDLIGIPKSEGAVSRFYPPSMIVREREFVLFIDELNIASQEIQKAFYSLILDKRIGEYRLPAGSIIIGAGNRAHDAALAKPMPSALVNRMVHVHLRARAAGRAALRLPHARPRHRLQGFPQADPQQVQRAQDPQGRRDLAVGARGPRPDVLPDAEPARHAGEGIARA